MNVNGQRPRAHVCDSTMTEVKRYNFWNPAVPEYFFACYLESMFNVAEPAHA